MEVADYGERRWAWWEVFVVSLFGLEEELENQEDQDYKGKECVE